MNTKLVTPLEAAAAMRVSINTAKKILAPHAIKIGARVRYREAAIAAVVSQGKAA